MENPNESRNIELFETYLRALTQGDSQRILGLFAPEVVQEEMPNRLYPNGQRRDLAALSLAATKGAQVLSRQSYRVRHVIAKGDEVVAELEWTGELKVAFGKLAAGSSLRAQVAMFLQMKDGRIVLQRNYDCYDPL